MMQYQTFGKVAAQFVLSKEGLHKSYLVVKDKKQLIDVVVPKLWSTYFLTKVKLQQFSRKTLLISKSPDLNSSIVTLST
jgi:hypothetical protein